MTEIHCVVVIMFASHVKCPRFEPAWNHVRFFIEFSSPFHQEHNKRMAVGWTRLRQRSGTAIARTDAFTHPRMSEGFDQVLYIAAGDMIHSLTLSEQRETVLERKFDNRLLWTNHDENKSPKGIQSVAKRENVRLWCVGFWALFSELSYFQKHFP